MAWISLFIAALFEIAWTYSLKYLNMAKFKKIQWLNFFSDPQHFYTIAPLSGYIIFGLGNIYFFSVALKQIPASTALATWMGLVLVGMKIVDIVVLKESFQYTQFFYMTLILVGIIGLKSGS
jgi:quaternary ammonium compound-resistance protein SugE